MHTLNIQNPMSAKPAVSSNTARERGAAGGAERVRRLRDKPATEGSGFKDALSERMTDVAHMRTSAGAAAGGCGRAVQINPGLLPRDDSKEPPPTEDTARLTGANRVAFAPARNSSLMATPGD